MQPHGLTAGYNPYDSGTLSKQSWKKKKDLRELSKWIELRKKLGDKTDAGGRRPDPSTPLRRVAQLGVAAQPVERTQFREHRSGRAWRRRRNRSSSRWQKRAAKRCASA